MPNQADPLNIGLQELLQQVVKCKRGTLKRCDSRIMIGLEKYDVSVYNMSRDDTVLVRVDFKQPKTKEQSDGKTKSSK